MQKILILGVSGMLGHTLFVFYHLSRILLVTGTTPYYARNKISII